MAQTNYTPVSLYYSSTATNVPLAANLVNGELAINITDGKLYYKDNAGVVQVIANKATLTSVDTLSFGSTGLTPATATTGNITVGGTLITSNGGTGLSSYTAGDTTYYASGTALTKLAIGAAGTIKTSTGTAPQWVASLNTSQGGTGLTSFTAGDLVYWSTGTTFTKLGIGTAGQVLTVNGGATAPQWSTASTGVTTISFGSTGLTPATATNGAVTVAGTLAIANGGTGASTLAGANISILNVAQTLTATKTFNGTTATAAIKTNNITELANVVGTAPTATTNFYINSGAVQYYTANNANNWTLNFAFSSGTTLNAAMSVGDSISCTMVVTNTTTAYYPSAFTVDGTSVTPKWQGGTAPTSGNASSIDSYTFVIIKTGSAVFTVLAAQTKFA
jgi:hypothetical protein